jgi:hypothetical protein
MSSFPISIDGRFISRMGLSTYGDDPFSVEYTARAIGVDANWV